MSDFYDDFDDPGCCALPEGHEGCCAFACSTCNGLGRFSCFPDDLGCDCGLCDGDGYCPECSGQGYFNEMGEPCIVHPSELAAER